MPGYQPILYPCWSYSSTGAALIVASAAQEATLPAGFTTARSAAADVAPALPTAALVNQAVSATSPPTPVAEGAAIVIPGVGIVGTSRRNRDEH